MSRRKQKRPQQLMSLTLGACRKLETMINNNSQLPLTLCSSLKGSQIASQLTEGQSLPCSPIKPHQQPLKDLQPSLSPDFPYSPLTSHIQFSPGFKLFASNSAAFVSAVNYPPRSSQMASPKLGLSATTTTSSSSSSSSASLCPPPHPGSPSRVPEGPPSPVTPTPTLILEELRVLQQRQIHQMQITEEICRQVLRLGGASYSIDTPPTASQPSTSMAPLLACFSSLLPSQAVNKPTQQSGAHGLTRVSSRSSAPLNSSSVATTVASSTYPLALSLALPSRYLHEKSPNTTSVSGHSGLSFLNTPLPTSVPIVPNSQHALQSASNGGESSSASSSNNTVGRLQHACRFCGKMFSSDSALQIHLRSHTGERPYQCPVCLSRFTTRGNLKVHFLRHREQNPELSLSLLPPSLFGIALGSTAGSDMGQNMSSGSSTSAMNTIQKKRKNRAEDETSGDSLEISGSSTGLPLGASGGSTPSSLPLPPSVDLALISHSLLQFNRAAVVAAAASITTGSSNSSSSSSSSTSSLGAKQHHFDENTPPHAPVLSPAAYSQLAHLPKLLFPTVSTPSSTPAAHSSLYNHPALGLLRTPLPSAPGSHQHASSSHSQLSFPFSSFPKVTGPPTTTNASSLPSSIAPTPTSETSKLQRLVEKLEKAPRPSSSPWTTSANSSFTNASMLPSLITDPAGNLTSNQCGVCLRVLSCPRALRLHQATHLGERPFPCKICGRSFSTKGSLRSHIATHHARPPNARVQNSCPLCQRKFTNALVLQHHIRMHLGGQLPPDGTEDSAHEMPADSKAISLVQSQSQCTDPNATSSSADPPVLTVSVPLPASQQTDQASPTGEDNQVPQATVGFNLPKSTPSPFTSSVTKTTESPTATEMDCGEDEVSTSSDAFLGSKSNVEDLQSTPALDDPFSYTCPSTTSNPNLCDGNTTTTLESDPVSPRPQSPEPINKDKELSSPPTTPKQDQATVPEGEPKLTSALEDTDTTGAEVRGEPQKTKKTYCCAECGKEYASRSGLKVRNKFHHLYQ
uniref:Sal-like protein 2-like n=1 Tax=Neolamprologus brichardi TaxID=32507 RepID=A0A3Q4MZA5_NEOBR